MFSGCMLTYSISACGPHLGRYLPGRGRRSLGPRKLLNLNQGIRFGVGSHNPSRKDSKISLIQLRYTYTKEYVVYYSYSLGEADVYTYQCSGEPHSRAPKPFIPFTNQGY